VAAVGIANALYGSYAWPYLDDALTAVREGDGGLLLAEYDMYFGGWDDGHNDDSIDAYFGIFCLDRDRDVSVDEVLDARDRLAAVAPLLGQGWLTEMLVCAQWPLPARPIPMVRADSETPVLVVGSTGDAATPIEGTRNMAKVLGNSMLLVVESDDHTSYGSNACATRIIDDYLIDLRQISDDEIC
jgi:pimeloyl-ACP methyl ester carboxylesterase